MLHRFPRALAGALVIGLAFAARPLPAAADAVEAFYKGRQLRFIIGADVGNEYDAWARLLARHMGRYIPGNPTFVAQNMPGAGQIIAANWLYNIADRDGTVIAMISRNLPFSAVTGDPALKLDPRKFSWIGSPEMARRVFAVHQRSKIMRMEDLREREMLAGGAGAGSGLTSGALLIGRLFDFKIRLVEGYRSASGAILAMERGEIDGICISIEAFHSARPGWIENGTLRVLFNLEGEPIPGTNAPSIFKMATTERQRQILSVFNAGADMGRPIAAPPGVPLERVAALRRALEQVLRDPEVIAEAARHKFQIGHTPGEWLAKRVDEVMATPIELARETERLAR